VPRGHAGGAALWLGCEQRNYLANLQLTQDVVPGASGNFSLEECSGQRFVLHMRLWTDEEPQALPVPPSHLDAPA